MKFFIVGVCVLFGSFDVIAQAPIEYTVSLPAPQTQIVEIECLIQDLTESSLEVKLPVWRPGKYQVLDPAGTLYHFTAKNLKGESLRVRKTDKSSWQIDLAGASAARIAYSIYANSLSDRTRHVDDSHAFLSGSAVFVYSPSRRSDPVLVRVEAPKSWRIASGLEADPENKNILRAGSYDLLVDSPLEIGIHRRHTFRVFERLHELIVWGEAEYDADAMVSDFKRIVENQIALWGRPPYERYVFLLHVGPGFRGGTEHINSTIMQADRERLEDPKLYKEFLGLVSHEFFHTWNIKQIRPSELSPYQYQVENYTSLLWLVEGTTSYYDDLSLVRTGLISTKEYYKRLSKLIDSYRRTPGRVVQSLAESSFDAWIKFTHPTPHSRNTTVSFYSKGALVSLLLDLFIRNETGGEAALDDVLRRLYQEFPLEGTGYTEADVKRLVDETIKKDCQSFFDSYVTGLSPLNLESALLTVGLKLALEGDSDSNSELESEKDSPPSHDPYLGLTIKAGKVASVLSDGPAFEAGLISGDEIVAIDGRRVREGSLKARLEDYDPGDVIEILLFRRDQLREIQVTLVPRPRGDWTVSPLEKPSEKQKAFNQQWIRQAWGE